VVCGVLLSVANGGANVILQAYSCKVFTSKLMLVHSTSHPLAKVVERVQQGSTALQQLCGRHYILANSTT